ncbi:MAG TPA: SDR family oxidoreductase [Anaerolineae bacterium]|nr:SDR family oxidoreductase [Anaerolineae bacterium]HOQ98086.1 SDR family oxidoreductase [Anaerolineae bacterium]HPL29717.1 SDR family oxidoreductase [Anaerolineae bacterium]
MILDLFKLDGQVALVTGGSTGLGQAVAIALAEAGADVAILYSSRPEATRHAIQALKRRLMGVQLDIASANVTQLQGAVLQVTNQLGRLDIVVNCTASAAQPLAMDYAEKDWDGMHADLKAAFFVSQAAAQHFRTVGHGKIINIGAMLSAGDQATGAAHLPTRNNLLGLTRLLANQWAPLGINVNCIIPGFVSLSPEAQHELEAQVTAGRWGTVEDIQAAVVYLASAAADYVHGMALHVDGGLAAR